MLSKSETFWRSNCFVYSIAFFGVIVRTVQYLSGRSLWTDEIMLSMNILDKSFSELLGTLDHLQVAPIGFLWFQKASVLVLGNSEYSLRLLPFVAGVISIFLFIKAARYIVSPNAVPIALVLFVTSGTLIYYSSEVKQYSLDVMITLLLLTASFHIIDSGQKFWQLLLFGLLGSLLVWFSSPAVIVLGAIGITWTLTSLFEKEWSKSICLIFVFSICIISIAANYILHNNENIITQRQLDYWNNAWMPLLPTSFGDLYWFWQTAEKYFRYPAGFSSNTHLIILVFLAGLFCIYLANKRFFLISVIVISFLLILSGLHIYPFHARTVLFTLPFAYFFVAEGVELIRHRIWESFPLAAVGLIVVVCAMPVLDSVRLVFSPYSKQEIKPVMKYVSEHKQAGDKIYVYYRARLGFKYYRDKYGLGDAVFGSNTGKDANSPLEKGLQKRASRLDSLKGNERVWFIFTNGQGGRPLTDEVFFLYKLGEIGLEIERFKADSSSVYLFDLSL